MMYQQSIRSHPYRIAELECFCYVISYTKQINNSLMKCINIIHMKKITRFSKQFLQYFDMFPTTQFVRYRQSSDYKTATGGCVSIMVLIIFIILFYNLGIQTINQQIINSSVTYNIEVEPQPLTYEFTKGSDFMFSIGLKGIDVTNSSNKIFNISLRQNHYGPLYSNNSFTDIPLTPCTYDHFSKTANILSFYEQFQLKRTLCPTLNSNFTIGGKITSSKYSELSVHIDYCNKTIDSACATDSQVLQLQTKLGGFTIHVPIINTIVNAGDSQYKQVYIQERNSYYFTTTSGLCQIQKQQINTDVSLLPFTDIQSQQIVAIPTPFTAKFKPVYNGKYVQIVFNKSGRSTIFTRSFNKVDDYFSYVGGLVGTIIMLFFILGAYSDQSYIVSIASDLYHLEEDKSQSKDFNFVYFVAIHLKKIFDKIGLKLPWNNSTKFAQAIQQMEKQLSVSYLLGKINYLQEAVSSILTKHQITVLRTKSKMTIKKAAAQRRQSKYQKKRIRPEQIVNNQSNVLIHNDSSIKQKDSNQQQQSFSSLQPFSQIESNQNSSAEGIKNQNQPNNHKLKNSWAQIIKESKQGNTISRRILQKVTNKVYPLVSISQKQKQEPSKDKFDDNFQFVQKNIDAAGYEFEQQND